MLMGYRRMSMPTALTAGSSLRAEAGSGTTKQQGLLDILFRHPWAFLPTISRQERAGFIVNIPHEKLAHDDE